jgi:hypothetical protein
MRPFIVSPFFFMYAATEGSVFQQFAFTFQRCAREGGVGWGGGWGELRVDTGGGQRGEKGKRPRADVGRKTPEKGDTEGGTLITITREHEHRDLGYTTMFV